MKILKQEVLCASAKYEGNIIAKVANGIVLYVGIAKNDTRKNIENLISYIDGCCTKHTKNIMPKNNSENEIENFEVLILSQFTLLASFKGTKPSFHNAELHEKAKEMFYDLCLVLNKKYPNTVKTGIFGEYLEIDIEMKNKMVELLYI